MNVIEKLKKSFLEKKTVNIYGKDYLITKMTENRTPSSHRVEYTFELTSVFESEIITFTMV
jgi:hypothetical protein